jgi:cobalt-zinc-cadmium efflux system membrane fusion protein
MHGSELSDRPDTGTSATASSRPRRRWGRIIFGLLSLGGVLAAAVWAINHPDQVELLKQRLFAAQEPVPTKPDEVTPQKKNDSEPWDGKIRVTEQQRKAIGLTTKAVAAQTEPVRLELLGTTKYEEDTLTRIRPMFKARVDKVHATVGSTVRKGEPLIELFSSDLADAKMAYEIKKIQWKYDDNLLKAREDLRRTKAISDQLFLETQNTEMKSRREAEVARDKLLVFGLTDQEIDSIEKQPGAEKARYVLRSPTDGIVIERDAVPGNLYDEEDNLLKIAHLDRLWVWGNVFESDMSQIELGQDWEIHFPFLHLSVKGTVDYIANQVDPLTHAIRVRTTIPNLTGKLKSDMLVRGLILIPPNPANVVIPRVAMVVADGHDYVYVRSSDDENVFERRLIKVVKEKESEVIANSGIKVGEQAVVTGSLIMHQIYEDTELVHRGFRDVPVDLD